MMIIERSTEG